MIDTLRYANRLKDAGVEALQAEAMALALNDELVSGLATKADIDHAANGLRADLDQAVDALRGEMGELGSEVGELRGKLGELRAELRGETAELRAELRALSGKFETQGRHVFLVLALIAALGLFNAVAPHLGRTHTTANPPANVSAPASDSAASSPR
ncbi:MAG: hypothetical protein OXG82_18865 [Gammaproteobacteria bacterium]|nr:hypothetical protein [Gammaproteobacteria bacterium]